jgi:transposase InsO family protein
MCELLGVSASGYYEWTSRAPSDRDLTDAWLPEQIKEIWAANRKVYGAPRAHAELRLARGVRVGRKRLERLTRTARISGVVARKRGRTTIWVPGVRVARQHRRVVRVVETLKSRAAYGLVLSR